MGEIADMMLDGTLCQICGVYLGGNGYPQTCDSCAKSSTVSTCPILCLICGKRCRGTTGLKQHTKAVHGKKQP